MIGFDENETARNRIEDAGILVKPPATPYMQMYLKA